MQEKSSILEQCVLKQGRNIHDSMCSCTFYYEINHLDLLKKLKLVIYIRLFSVIVCVLSKLPMRSLFLCFHQFVMKYIFI